MENTDGYTIKEAAGRIGRSVSWVRARVRDHSLTPDSVPGKYGMEYRFTERDIMHAASLLPMPRTKRGGITEAATIATRSQELALRYETLLAESAVTIARLESERDSQALHLEQVNMEREQERTRLLEERDAERERLEQERGRVERLKSLGVWGYLFGKHRNV